MDRASIPSAFKELHQAGRFDYWGAPYHSLTSDQRDERIRTYMTRVLWWSSIEWDRTPEEIAEFEGDEHLRPGLVPFAGNGYGDLYCWYPRWQTGPEPPVVFFIHDELESHLFARTFAECMCRCLLQSFAAWDDQALESSHVSKGQVWEAHREILRPFIDPEQIETLQALGADPSPEQCQRADDRISAAVGLRKLIGAQQPTRYAEEHIRDHATLLRSYDQSIAFYRELVQAEGLDHFRPKLEAAQAARAAVARRHGLR